MKLQKNIFVIALCSTICISSAALAEPQVRAASGSEKIDAYERRFGRNRPLIAVVALNEGTETVDFVVPFGVLARSGVADVISVSTGPGLVNKRFQLHATIDEFDRRYPEGADYVIVPNTVRNDDATLVKWVAAQGRKGGTLVGICVGALVVANTGLMDGHRATSYYATEKDRATKYPHVKWVSNRRYVADGKIVSSAGITAAMPTSIALVEAIAGRDKAAQLANELGVSDWSPEHNSDAFQRDQHDHTGMMGDANHDVIAIPVKPGDDEIALALTADAYSFTGKSRAYILSTSAAPVTLKHGLVVIPDRVVGGSDRITRVLPSLSAELPARSLDSALEDIAKSYGRSAAAAVAQMMEYPAFKK